MRGVLRDGGVLRGLRRSWAVSLPLDLFQLCSTSLKGAKRFDVPIFGATIFVAEGLDENRFHHHARRAADCLKVFPVADAEFESAGQTKIATATWPAF